MAKQIIVNVKANTSQAEAELNAIKQELQKLNKDTVTVGDTSKKEFKKYETSAIKAKESTKLLGKETSKAGKSFGKFGKVLKGLGIVSILVIAFDKLKELFMTNQRVVDIFKIAFEGLSIVFNDFVKFIEGAIGTVGDFFHTLFTEPQTLVKDFIKGVIDRTIERIQSAVDMVGLLGSAFKKLFSGDFAGALEDANSAGEEFVDIITGVDNTVQKVNEATTGYVKNVVKTAAANVELAKSAELAAVANQGLLEKFDLQAESLRQLRDDERLSIEERRKANDDLAAVLDEQEKIMLENAQISLAAAQAELKKDENNIEAKKRVMEAENELAAVRATVAGFRSEQLANDLALDKEEKEMINSKLEAESNLSIERKRFNAEQIDNNLQRLQKQKEIDALEQEQETARLQAIVDNANAGTQAKVDAQIALDTFLEESRQQNITRDKEISDEQKKIAEADLQNEQNIKNAKLALASQFGQALQMLAGKNKTAAIAGVLIEKAASIGQIISSTGLANAKAVAASPLTAGQPFVAINSISAGLSIATSLKSAQKAIQDIKSAGPGTASGVGSTGAGGGQNIPQAQAPAFNIVGATGTNQLAQTIAQQTRQPVKAYVVAGDVTTAQSLDRNIIQESALG